MIIAEKKFQTIQDFAQTAEKKLKKTTTTVVKEEKNMFLALFLSIFLPGLGLVYTGDKKKGIILFITTLVFYRLRKLEILLL